MNVFLLLVVFIAFFLTIGLALYLVTLYQSEDDKGTAIFPKFVVIIGLALSVFTVLLMPFDVAARQDVTELNGHDAGFSLVTMWFIVFWLIVFWTLMVTPFATFYYESFTPGQTSIMEQVKPAAMYTFATCFVFFLLFIILYFTMGVADLTYHSHTAPPQNVNLERYIAKDVGGNWETNGNPWSGNTCFCNKDDVMSCAGTSDGKRNDLEADKSGCVKDSGDMEIGVTAFVYMIGLLTALGWLTFVPFGGVGIIALPVDLINGWRNRPKKISRAEYNDRKALLAEELQTLHTEGKKLRNKAEEGQKGFFNSTQKGINKWQEKVTLLEEKWENLELAMDPKRNVVLDFLKLPIGVLGVLLSFLWVLHMLVHNLADAGWFLSGLFIGLDSFFPVFGVIVYSVFAMWMLWAAVKGCFKLGCNFGIIKVHPMKLGATVMSSMLFNTLLVLITSVTVCQFCALSFRDYAANTVIDNLLNTYVVRLRGVGYIMEYFQTVMLAFAGLTVLFLLCQGMRAKKA
eukprot:TRINITY_DN4047_c0_g2_i1.p1 TRINITY_DN4047_c0_g2~~TRINITY_DN4047_c0_g2_i1.p1  ORF type:complete len:515 (+),score=208.81 TRINITY_DN4047_c0_g2_i1:129-1673(+)